MFTAAFSALSGPVQRFALKRSGGAATKLKSVVFLTPGPPLPGKSTAEDFNFSDFSGKSEILRLCARHDAQSIPPPRAPHTPPHTPFFTDGGVF